MMAADRPTYIKLNRDNYYMWSRIARPDLIERKCWDAAVRGFLDESGNKVPIKDWTGPQIDKNDSALAYILKAVEPYYIEDIGECSIDQEAWETLEEINSKFSILHTLMHLRDLVTTQKGNSETMQDYLGRITSLNRKCSKSGLVFGEKADAFFYLLGLPKEYEDSARSLEREDKELTPRLARRAKLLADEKRVGRAHCAKNTDNADLDEAQVFTARQTFSDHPARGSPATASHLSQHPYSRPQPAPWRRRQWSRPIRRGLGTTRGSGGSRGGSSRGYGGVGGERQDGVSHNRESP